MVSSVLDYESKNTYIIRIKTSVSRGLTFEKAIVINISDVSESSGGGVPGHDSDIYAVVDDTKESLYSNMKIRASKNSNSKTIAMNIDKPEEYPYYFNENVCANDNGLQIVS